MPTACLVDGHAGHARPSSAVSRKQVYRLPFVQMSIDPGEMWQRSVCRTEYTYLRSVRGNQYFGSREKLSGTRQNLYSSRHKAAARRHSGTHPCIVPTHPHTYPQQSTYSPSIPAGRERRQHTFSENVLGGGMSLIILEYRSWCSTFR